MYSIRRDETGSNLAIVNDEDKVVALYIGDCQEVKDHAAKMVRTLNAECIAASVVSA